MRITDLLKKDTIIMDLSAADKASVIDELVAKLDQAGRLNDRAAYKEAILAREAQSTTGVGEGIAIPHAKTAAVKTPAVAFGRAKNGIDYEALDGQPSNLFFMIAAPDGANEAHLETLSSLSGFLMDPAFRDVLLNARTEQDIIDAFESREDAPAEEETAAPAQAGAPSVLAVTACPTGIAHTYMAADALKAKAKEKGINFKVETNGSSGVKNALTDAEIANATAIIVAADKQVEMERFKGKHVIQVPVAQGIRNPDGLLDRAVKQDAPVFQGGGGSSSSSDSGSAGNAFYKHLMSGVSAMLPLVVGGGILIAISFFFGIDAVNPDDPSFNPFAKALMDIGGGSAFALMIPVLAGFIAMSIADRPGLAPGLVGGILAANGGSGFLGGLIAGFLAGYAVVGLKKLFAGLPQALDGIKPVLLYPLFGIFITGMAMIYVINGPVSALNTWLVDALGGMGTSNLVLLGVILGGMMAVDMGGPVNKAAFTFGIAMIDAGNFAPHAAVMAGGMVPPLGIALATTFFKNRFTTQERDAGKTNYIMGASFITEGAIPFAAKDPARVIPAAIAGSAVAGALTMIFGVKLPAPHGGIFVFPIVEGSALLYLVAVLAGAAVTAVLLGFLKKPIKS
ncbi:PTS fructose transporter subunit IIABC [Domibacillus enclensis]|uniref:PTS fructose transporter subunit IIA n=1 Tax=Domibacillus enclensis TaxID=1017273 RepID=A0A1N6PXK5_9BACI|nr:PTS fructose transporter subunit IIABC [Domibacillus enclensis]OXS80512.1 PTS fructose transporter subunit IIA [Domibacillus enclensis]SIQ09053.1 PTS system D-fructose-specific IIA component (F1P-forming), Frc family /PTS system D-fructose-specific IIB component (F1P-forming), Frc family /PTS system D-fructose-specific IIC component (F1P-forming), Frc family [Domibacillus enclensis]